MYGWGSVAGVIRSTCIRLYVPESACSYVSLYFCASISLLLSAFHVSLSLFPKNIVYALLRPVGRPLEGSALHVSSMSLFFSVIHKPKPYGTYRYEHIYPYTCIYVYIYTDICVYKTILAYVYIYASVSTGGAWLIFGLCQIMSSFRWAKTINRSMWRVFRLGTIRAGKG